MPWVKPDSDEFEYRCVEWRAFQEEKAQKEMDRLIADGWELDGPSSVKAGMSVDLYWQQLRRPKK